MEEAIKQLAQILAKEDSSKVVRATEICRDQSANADTCRMMIPLLQPLLKLTSSSTEEVAENALVTLINISSNCTFAINDLIKINAANRILDSILSMDGLCVHKRLMLLTNLTTITEGTIQLLDLSDEALKGQRLLRLAVRFASPVSPLEISRATEFKGLSVIASGPTDDYEYAAQVLMNATLCPAARQILYDHPDFFMPALLENLGSDNPIRKQGIIGVVRNLCFDEIRHEFLIEKVKILPYLLKPLIPKSIEDNLTAFDMIRDSFPGITFGNVEPLAANRRNLLDSILLLAQSDYGKNYLIRTNVIFIMREVDAYETDEDNKNIAVRIGARLLPPDESEDKKADK